MNRWHAWLQHAANLLVGVSGLVYFVMKHLLVSEDPFAVVNHPLQPHVQHLHVLAAPLLVFATGLLWASHAGPRLQAPVGPYRRSGLLMMVGFAPMAASGYLLQVSVESGWRTFWLWAHLATGGVWLLGYTAHVVRRVSTLRARQRKTARLQDPVIYSR